MPDARRRVGVACLAAGGRLSLLGSRLLDGDGDDVRTIGSLLRLMRRMLRGSGWDSSVSPCVCRTRKENSDEKPLHRIVA